MHNYKCVTLRLQRNVELRDNKPNIHVIALGATNFINFTSLGLFNRSAAAAPDLPHQILLEFGSVHVGLAITNPTLVVVSRHAAAATTEAAAPAVAALGAAATLSQILK